jgi:hypothetical protein
MSEERRRILQMLSDGKVTVPEAEQLLDAVGHSAASDAAPGDEGPKTEAKRKYLTIEVRSKSGSAEGKRENVNVRVPLVLLRSGLKLASIMPSEARCKVEGALAEKGVGFQISDLSPEAIDELMEGMRDLSIHVDSDDETVRVFCE